MPHGIPDDLFCGEDARELELELELAEPPHLSIAAAEADFPDDSGESIAGFIREEATYFPRFDYPNRLRSCSVDAGARAESIAWIRQVQSHYQFHPLTAFLAVNYMDRFLSLHRLPGNGWAMQLLTVSCLSLAAKMEETLVPSLLHLQVGGAKFVFEPRTIRRMELLILTALNWRLRSVTPFTFIDFFAYKADPSGKNTKSVASRAAQIVLSSIQDVELLDYGPSSVAAAAVLCAADEVPALAFANPAVAVSWCLGLTEEGISKCYQQMQQAAINDLQRKYPMILSQLRVSTAAHLGSSSSPPCKRRRLNDT